MLRKEWQSGLAFLDAAFSQRLENVVARGLDFAVAQRATTTPLELTCLLLIFGFQALRESIALLRRRGMKVQPLLNMVYPRHQGCEDVADKWAAISPCAISFASF